MKAINFILMAFLLTGCCRSSDEVWDDTRTAGRHMGRGFRSLGGKHGDSRQVRCREDFLQCDDDYCIEDFQAMQFEPLPDQEYGNEVAMVDTTPRNTPYHTNHAPGIEEFKDPSSNPEHEQVFKNLNFPYNSSLLKGKENWNRLRLIADYCKRHPDTYLFIEGHCDERGAEAYNLALGSRRSNAVRNSLIKEGVSPENLFTVSYGKERPLNPGHTEEAWAENRRAQFKVYQN